MKASILFVVPLPPPFAGVEYVSNLLLESPLSQTYDLKVIKSNIRSHNADKGAWDFSGIFRVGVICLKLVASILKKRPALVYLTISQNMTGLCRDCAYLFICQVFRVPVIGHFHGSKLAEFLKSIPVFQRSVFLYFLKRVSKIIVCAHSIKNSLVSFLPENGISVVYNGISENSKVKLNAKFLKSSKDFVVGFMGHLSEAKGFYDLLNVAEVMLGKYSHVIFAFAGERLTQERNVLIADGEVNLTNNWNRVRKLQEKYPDRIKIMGVVSGDEKASFFSWLDLFVLPSYSEAFPIAVFEAMNTRIPLVTTPMGALPEVLEDGKSCIFVEPGALTGLLEAIETLLKDSILRSNLAEAGYRIAQTFTVEKMVGEVKRNFEETINR